MPAGGGTGGNWKDLLKAAGEGNRKVVQLHLSDGVDPFFQHPEYFTAPIFEAIRNGHLEIVQLLLEYQGEDGRSMLDLQEEMSDSTPLEAAFATKQHAIVNHILSLFGDKSKRPDYIKSMGILGFDDDPTTRHDLVHSIAEAGHRVAVVLPLTDVESKVQHNVMVSQIRTATGNPHVYVVGTGADDPIVRGRGLDPIDVWIGEGSSNDAATRIQNIFPRESKQGTDQSEAGAMGKVVWCVSHSSQTKSVVAAFPEYKVVLAQPSWTRWLFSFVGVTATWNTAEIYRLALEEGRSKRDDAILF